MAYSIIKHPDAVLDYGFDWSDWLESGETIVSSDWDVPSGLVEDTDSDHVPGGFDDITTSIWLSGGVLGEDCDVVNDIITSEGRKDSRTVTIKVRSR